MFRVDDLDEDSGRVARLFQALGDLVQVALMRDLHRDHADSVLAGQFERVRKAAPAETLESVRAAPGFVGAHPGADLPLALERLHHGLDTLAAVHGAEPGENVEVVWREGHPVVLEARGPVVILVAAQDPVLLGGESG